MKTYQASPEQQPQIGKLQRIRKQGKETRARLPPPATNQNPSTANCSATDIALSLKSVNSNVTHENTFSEAATELHDNRTNDGISSAPSHSKEDDSGERYNIMNSNRNDVRCEIDSILHNNVGIEVEAKYSK